MFFSTVLESLSFSSTWYNWLSVSWKLCLWQLLVLAFFDTLLSAFSFRFMHNDKLLKLGICRRTFYVNNANHACLVTLYVSTSINDDDAEKLER